jgi:hypothetical protein
MRSAYLTTAEVNRHTARKYWGIVMAWALLCGVT